MEEKADTMESQSEGDSSCCRFTWTIDNFSKLKVKKLYSDIFHAGGYKWRILIFPDGNNVDYFSIYLDVADSETLPKGWSRDALFSLSVINQVDSKNSVKKETQHVFKAIESDCGFTSFLPLDELYSFDRGFILNDTCIVEAEVSLNGLEKSEAHLYTILKVARDEDLIKQIGRNIYFDLVDHDKVRSFRIKKTEPFYQFKEKVAKEFGIPVQCQRFWLWAKRQNHTYRPFKPLTLLEERRHVGKLREITNKTNTTELKLFLEVELNLGMQPVAPPQKTEKEILLFFKLYDPLKEELRYVGRMFVDGSGKPIEILTKLNEMAGFRRNQEIELYEEIKFEPCVLCEPVDKEISFCGSQLEDGDIICFQKSQDGISEKFRYPDVRSFLEYLHKRQSIEAQDEQSNPLDSQTGISDAHETKPPPRSVNVPPEQSIPSAKSEEGLDQEPVSEKTRAHAEAEKDRPCNSFCCNENPVAHSTVPQSEEVETLKMDDTQAMTKTAMTQSAPLVDQSSADPLKEPTFENAETSSYSFAELDILFSDIQNLLEGKSSSFQPPQFTNEEIANAKETFRQCLNMKLARVMEMGRAPEFKKSLSILLTVNAFTNDMAHEMTRLLANFDRNRESYISAQQDLKEAREKQDSVSELKTILKELSLEFVPIRNRANEVDQEVAALERQLAERKEERRQLKNSLEDLAGRAGASRQALINAEQEMRLFMHKKEQADEVVGDIERLWESLKKDYCLLTFYTS